MKQEEFTKQIDGLDLAVIPLGGQSELGQVLWVISHKGRMILLDAGASYPNRELPGVHLLLPNTNFLQENQNNIEALLLTNGSEEYMGAVSYLLKHVAIPKIMGPKFIVCLLNQIKINLPVDHPLQNVEIESVQIRQSYKLGPFTIEWIRVNDFIAQASALYLTTPENQIMYMPSYKLDQTPVNDQLTDIARLAELGEKGISLLIASSAGIERTGYSESELTLFERICSLAKEAKGRVIVLIDGSNTHRLQVLINIAKRCKRKILLLGEQLLHSAVASTMTGDLHYDPELEVSISGFSQLSDDSLLIIATGKEGNPMSVLSQIASAKHEIFNAKQGDTIIYSSEVPPGRLRQMAMFLDQFLLRGVKIYWGEEQGMHVPRSASQEELKLAISLIKPKYFIPAFGEGRHIIHHAKLANECGMSESNIFPLQNGQIFNISKEAGFIEGKIESQAVLVNRDQDERITTFTVNERRAMSLEGLITISIVIDKNYNLIGTPQFGCSAASFRYSIQWKEACSEMTKNITEAYKEKLEKQFLQDKTDKVSIRALIRDTAFKTLRSYLQTKPVLQIIVQQLNDDKENGNATNK